jgi:hypothetical protein
LTAKLVPYLAAIVDAGIDLHPAVFTLAISITSGTASGANTVKGGSIEFVRSGGGIIDAFPITLISAIGAVRKTTKQIVTASLASRRGLGSKALLEFNGAMLVQTVPVQVAGKIETTIIL